jgi:anti-anti-sigma factor
MPLQLETRSLGDAIVIRCRGRIVAGPEAQALQSCLKEIFPEGRILVLHLADVAFIDSSGLGTLVRLLASARQARGDLRLCAIPPFIRQAFQITNILNLFQTYDSETEAATAIHGGAEPSRSASSASELRVLCVHDSPDLLAYLGELLRRAGYRVLTCGNIYDAQILLKAAPARLIVLASRLLTVHGKSTRLAFGEIAPAVPIVVLDEDFSTQEAGGAAKHLLEMIGGILPSLAQS